MLVKWALNFLVKLITLIGSDTSFCPGLDQGIARTAQITKFMGPIWGLPRSCRPQMGPMLAPWTLLSGRCWLIVTLWHKIQWNSDTTVSFDENSMVFAKFRPCWSDIFVWMSMRWMTQWDPFIYEHLCTRGTIVRLPLTKVYEPITEILPNSPSLNV